MKKAVQQWFQTFFWFSPLPGEMIQFDEHIFQMGWNHQLGVICIVYMSCWIVIIVVNLPGSHLLEAPGNGCKFTCPERRVVPSWTGAGVAVVGATRGRIGVHPYINGRGDKTSCTTWIGVMWTWQKCNQPPPSTNGSKDVELSTVIFLVDGQEAVFFPPSMAKTGQKTWVDWF